MTNNNEKLNQLIDTLSKRLGTEPDKLQQAAQQGDVKNLLNKMDQKQADKLQKILSDEQATKKLLETPQAQALLKKLMGDK